MPRFDPVAPDAGPSVRGFSAGRFLVGPDAYTALLLTPQKAEAWVPPALAELTIASVAPLLALDPPPEFLLLGTGPTLARPPLAFVAALEEQGIGVEAMDSRAAARAWVVLRAEQRWIGAALMPLA